MALSLHEGVPGHHLQLSYLQNNPSTPDFRRFIDYTAVNNAPARFPLHTVFIEGWGLYAEFLGDELGLYTDPYQRCESVSKYGSNYTPEQSSGTCSIIKYSVPLRCELSLLFEWPESKLSLNREVGGYEECMKDKDWQCNLATVF